MFCTLLEKISFFVNFLPYVFFFPFWTCILFNSFSFCSSSKISFSFGPGIGDRRGVFFCDRSALNVEQCVVIQSDCVVCYLFSHGDD